MLSKGILAICLILSHSLTLRAQDIVRFRVSKPYCLLNFLNTCNGDRNASRGLTAFIERQGLLKDTAFQHILADFRQIPLDYTYGREQFPERRMRSRYGRVIDILVMAAVGSDDLDQFSAKAYGLLPNSDHEQLLKLMRLAMPCYDSLVWQRSIAELNAQTDTLKRYAGRISQLFVRLNRFYRSSWAAGMPFVVTFYPVPGRRSGTAATPHINALCVGVRTSDNDYDGIAGVVLHEMCHSLYNEQAAPVQRSLDSLFMADTSAYRDFALNYFDEGLATACGNGWARESLNQKTDKGEWYHDTYIDGYAHGLFPMVKEYLEQGRSLDSGFVSRSIKIFAGLFPRAPYDYDLLLSNLNLYSDAEGREERHDLYGSIGRHFKMLSYSSSSPILDPKSLDILEQSAPTQLVIVQKNIAANLAKLKTVFPQLSALLEEKLDTDFAATFFDQKKRAVIIIKAESPDSLSRALSLLRKNRYMSAAPQYLPLR